MITVYVIRSITSGKLYTGQTANIERRFEQHQSGASRYTRGKGPWEIVLTENHATLREAMQRERFLKSGQGREWLKKKLEQCGGSSGENG